MIPNQWYPILIEDEVKNDAPFGTRRLGQELVLWRDIDGNLVCQSARCPHKGANLSKGRMKGNSVECPYHGFRFGTDGACKAIPAMGADAKIPGSLKVQTYPVREKFGLIWMWYGDDRDEADLPDIQASSEILENDRLHAEKEKLFSTQRWTRPVHYTRYIESLLEFYHVTYVHRDHWFNYVDYLFLYGTPQKLGMDGKERYLAATKIENHHVEVDGPSIRYTFDHCEEDDPSNSTHYIITFTFPCTVHVVTEQFESTSFLVPIDDGHTEHIMRWYEYENLKPILRSEKLRALMPWASLYMEKWVQDPQDARIMEHQEPKISAGGINKFIPVDEGNAKYVAMRAKLIQEAKESQEARESKEAKGSKESKESKGAEQRTGTKAKPRRNGTANGTANGNGNGNGNGHGHRNGVNVEAPLGEEAAEATAAHPVR